MTKRNRLIALLISFVMIVSMFTVCISATEAGTQAATEAGTQAATEAGTSASTEKATEKTTEKSTEAATDEHGHAAGTHDNEISKGEWITNIVVIGLIVIVAVVLIIKFRAKLAAFLRSVKSELKKIVWASGKDTRKNYLVVLVIAIAVAAIIGILDFAFSEGIAGIVKLLNK